jgi:hypothetical protein
MVRVGDVGIEIIFDLGEDISAATAHKFIYRKPNGVSGEFTTTLLTTQLKYATTSSADLDQAGLWTIQAYIEMPGIKAHTAPAKFEVGGNLS